MNSFTHVLKLAAENKRPQLNETERGILDSVRNAASTIDDDPGNHKKKGLASLGGAALSTYFGTKLIPNIPRPTSIQPPSTASLLAIPSGLLYAANNAKNKLKVGLGLGLAGAGLIAANSGARSTQGPTLTTGQRVAVAGALLAPTALTAYGLHELKKSEEIQRERQRISTQTNPVDGPEALNPTKNTTPY